jgi:hypothetical protein
VPGKKQCFKERKIKHLKKLSIAERENESIQRWRIEEIKITDKQFSKCSLKIKIIFVAWWKDTKDSWTLQKTWDLEIKGTSFLWKYFGWRRNIWGNEKSIPRAHSRIIWRIQVFEQLL